jgi:hypothetical protein
MMFTDTIQHYKFLWEKSDILVWTLFSQHFLAAMSLNRFINNTLAGDDSSLFSTKRKAICNNKTQIWLFKAAYT